MKIRSGFVSNSSSSSFILLGITIYDDINDAESIDKYFIESVAEVLHEHNDEMWILEEHFGVTYGFDDDCGHYLGIDPDFSDNDRTIGSLKNESLEKLNSVLKEPVELKDITFCYGSSYNG